MLSRVYLIQDRLDSLPVEAVSERALLQRELVVLKSKLSRIDSWKLSKGIRE